MMLLLLDQIADQAARGEDSSTLARRLGLQDPNRDWLMAGKRALEWIMARADLSDVERRHAAAIHDKTVGVLAASLDAFGPMDMAVDNLEASATRKRKTVEGTRVA